MTIDEEQIIQTVLFVKKGRLISLKFKLKGHAYREDGKVER